jgi:hypothetical protein
VPPLQESHAPAAARACRCARAPLYRPSESRHIMLTTYLHSAKFRRPDERAYRRLPIIARGPDMLSLGCRIRCHHMCLYKHLCRVWCGVTCLSSAAGKRESIALPLQVRCKWKSAASVTRSTTRPIATPPPPPPPRVRLVARPIARTCHHRHRPPSPPCRPSSQYAPPRRVGPHPPRLSHCARVVRCRRVVRRALQTAPTTPRRGGRQPLARTACADATLSCSRLALSRAQ